MSRRWAMTFAAVLALSGCSLVARVDVSPTGDAGDQGAYPIGMSADGRYVSFASSASNLVPGDTNGAQDIFRRDLQTSTTIRVSVKPDGSQVTGGSSGGSMDSAGAVVVFDTSDGLVPGDTNMSQDVYVRDIDAGTTTLASVAAGGALLVGPPVSGSRSSARSGGISANGRLIALTLQTANLSARRVFVRDRVAPTTTEVDLAGNVFRVVTAMSGDGSHLALAGVQSCALCTPGPGSVIDLGSDQLAQRTFCAGTTVVALSGDGRHAALNPGGSGIGCTAVPGPSVWNRALTADNIQPVTLGGGVVTTLRIVAMDSFGTRLALADTSTSVHQITTINTNANFSVPSTTVSADSWGRIGNASSSAAAMSADGRKIVFSSRASNLVGDDPVMAFDHLYVRDVSIPHLSSVSPTSVARGTFGVTLTVIGSGLRGPVTIVVSGVGAIGNEFAFFDGSQASGVGLNVPADATPGSHDVWVSQGSSSALCGGCFTVT